jgi:hypothetical protein
MNNNNKITLSSNPVSRLHCRKCIDVWVGEVRELGLHSSSLYRVEISLLGYPQPQIPYRVQGFLWQNTKLKQFSPNLKAYPCKINTHPVKTSIRDLS